MRIHGLTCELQNHRLVKFSQSENFFQRYFIRKHGTRNPPSANRILQILVRHHLQTISGTCRHGGFWLFNLDPEQIHARDKVKTYGWLGCERKWLVTSRVDTPSVYVCRRGWCLYGAFFSKRDRLIIESHATLKHSNGPTAWPDVPTRVKTIEFIIPTTWRVIDHSPLSLSLCVYVSCSLDREAAERKNTWEHVSLSLKGLPLQFLLRNRILLV